MKCPCCGNKTLRRYAKENFPIIDLVCISDKHDNESVRFFQVKSSYLINNNASFNINNEPYFSRENRTIMTGSKRWGEVVHNIKYSDDITIKKILIGYICILFTTKKDIMGNDKEITINKKKSFLVLPYVSDRDLNPNYNNEYYYNYTNFSHHPQIQFNPNLNYIGDLNGKNDLFDGNTSDSNIYLDTNIIPINYTNDTSKWQIMENPLNV